MLTDALKALVNNLVKENFNEKKKTIIVLIAFFISHKRNVKIFFNWNLNQFSKDTH